MQIHHTSPHGFQATISSPSTAFTAARARRDMDDISGPGTPAHSKGASMATYQVTYWQEIPSQVDARDEGGKAHKEILSQRFQELIDIVATKRKLTASDDYINAWNKGKKTPREGAAADVARAVAAELEGAYETIRANALKQ
jgi:hypothetical protein